MTIKLSILCGLLLFYSQLSVANANENPPKPTETLPDPTVSSTAKLRERFIAPLEKKTDTTPTPNTTPTPIGEIEDPTKMNANFRAAITQSKQIKSTTGGVANAPVAPPPPSLPALKLLAIACAHHKEKNHVMLSINSKTEMIGLGEKTSVVINAQIVEIEVLDIQKNHVHLRLYPSNETIILR